MGCTPSFLRSSQTVAQRISDREDALKDMELQMIRAMVEEENATRHSAMQCRSAIHQNDMELAEIYASAVLQHRDNKRAIALAQLRLTAVLNSLRQAGNQHAVAIAMQGLERTLRQLNQRTSVRSFGDLARRVGIQLNKVEHKSKAMNQSITKTHGNTDQSEADAQRAEEIAAVLTQCRDARSRPRIQVREVTSEEPDEEEDDVAADPIVILASLSDDEGGEDDSVDNALSARLADIKRGSKRQ